MRRKALQLRKIDTFNEFSGFTLVECVFALFLLSIICLLFSASIKSAAVITDRLKSEREKEWHIFIIQLENELKNCQHEKTETNKMILRNYKNNKTVWIEYKLNKIVKVENGGYHPLLIGVKKVEFIEEGKSIVIKAVFENNLHVKAKWIITKEYQYERA